MEIVILDKNSIEIFLDFINDNYEQAIIYCKNYLRYQLNDKYKVFGLKLDNELIGTICWALYKNNY